MDEANGKILVVDDEESVRSIISRGLQSMGYECVTAADGKEALWKAFMQDFDLVLTDIKMPGISGMEVLSQITKEHPDTVVVMISALADTKTAVEAMKLGACDYVTKPFNLDDLAVRVERALERRKLVMENREHQLHLEQKVKSQVGQIQQYYHEAIEALAREETALKELSKGGGKEHGETTADTKAAAKSREASSSVKGIARKLSQMIGGAIPESPGDISDTAIAQTGTIIEEPQTQQGRGRQKKKKKSLALYQGVAELAIVPPVSLYQMMQLHEHLRIIPQIQILNLGGSVDKGITVRLILESPAPLIQILREQPEVERASDESQVSEQKVPRRKGEDPPVRRIVVELLEKSATEDADPTPD